MIKIARISGDLAEELISETPEHLLYLARSQLDFDGEFGTLVVEDDSGSHYVVDLALVPLEDAREELQDAAAYYVDNFETSRG